jgi:hypothetical protein
MIDWCVGRREAARRKRGIRGDEGSTHGLGSEPLLVILRAHFRPSDLLRGLRSCEWG